MQKAAANAMPLAKLIATGKQVANLSTDVPPLAMVGTRYLFNLGIVNTLPFQFDGRSLVASRCWSTLRGVCIRLVFRSEGKPGRHRSKQQLGDAQPVVRAF